MTPIASTADALTVSNYLGFQVGGGRGKGCRGGQPGRAAGRNPLGSTNRRVQRGVAPHVEGHWKACGKQFEDAAAAQCKGGPHWLAEVQDSVVL